MRNRVVWVFPKQLQMRNSKVYAKSISDNYPSFLKKKNKVSIKLDNDTFFKESLIIQ